MKILTWNINGIRAEAAKKAETGQGYSFKGVLDSLDADIVSLQETKVTRDQLEETVAIVDGYTSYFSFCRVRLGYSGVATYCRNGCMPIRAEEGLTGALKSHTTVDDSIGCYGKLEEWSEKDKQAVDSEGRAVLTEHQVSSGQTAVLINVYCPCTIGEDSKRVDYKLTFYRALEERCIALRNAGKHVVVLGDLNCSHQPIDICDFDHTELNLFKSRPSVQWLDNFLITAPLKAEVQVKECHAEDSHQKSGEEAYSGLVVDIFRHFHPSREHAYTCWNMKTSARKTNYGTRIDYILVDPSLLSSAVESDIMPEVEGSDHCPVYVRFNEDWLSSGQAPSLSTENMPEFAVRQQTITSFFTRGQSTQAKATNEQRSEEAEFSAAMPLKRTLSEPVESGGKKVCKMGSQLGKSKSQQASLLGFIDQTRKKGNSQQTCISSSVSTKSENTDVPQPKKNVASIGKNRSGPRNQQSAASVWKGLFGGPRATPLCRGHREPCVMHTVQKAGPNQYRQFYVCARPSGSKTNPAARCEHFEWASDNKFKSAAPLGAKGVNERRT